ncbi:TniQ family protein [Nocardia camponoti]|uniref:TniQ domain-containing protein n=1 Tax=Nocardia camponoti TaxID=1616106 RepID=A0A917Q8K8_9NOCA|nr:TniQ family protein [Nocardia camponoti]GGK35295.1 hypothetical protein GCM10011591_03710 [Nocardia camponoti]
MKQGWRAPGLARQLPIPIPPAPNETTASYLGRLATVNHLAIDELKIHLGMNPTLLELRMRPPNLGRLVVITGYSRDQLTRALPELTSRHRDSTHLANWARPACPRCIRRHTGGRVIRYYPSYVHACPKHRIWLSDKHSHRHRLLDISAVPEVLAAHTTHRRLARRHQPQPAQYAFRTARRLFEDNDFWNSFADTTAFAGISNRLDILNPGETRVLIDDPSFLAAIYPNAVDTAALLASPHWRRIASRKETVTRFLIELGTRVSGQRRTYWPRRNRDPIANWIEGLSREHIDWKRIELPSRRIPRPL